MGQSKSIWIAYEANEYELPLAVADTAREIGKMFGLTERGVLGSCRRERQGERSGVRFARIEVGFEWRKENVL